MDTYILYMYEYKNSCCHYQYEIATLHTANAQLFTLYTHMYEHVYMYM